jgi:hypothetical protein
MGKKSKKTKEKKTKNLKTKKVKKVKSLNHNIKLRVAKKIDFLELDKYETVPGKNKKKKVWKMIKGYPYWMFNSKGEIENNNYILDENTDLDEFNNYLVRQQILILTSRFD